MNIDAIKKEIIYSESIERIFEISIELSEEIGRLHIESIKAKDHLDKTVLKAQITVLTTLQGIIEKRIEDPKSLIRENKERQELLVNRLFRTAAHTVLKKETYDRILEIANQNYKEFKEQKSELRANKLE